MGIFGIRTSVCTACERREIIGIVTSWHTTDSIPQSISLLLGMDLCVHRETCIDEITFDEDGYMQIKPTNEGVDPVKMTPKSWKLS